VTDAPGDKDPHDTLFRETFGVPEHARGELTTVLPPALVARLDWATLRAESASFVSMGEQKRHADVLLSVGVRGGGEVLVYVLLEHQSTADPWMVLRLLRYMVRIWERWLRDHPETRRLPPVVPVVVSHDPQGWRVPVGLEEALDIDDATLKALRAHLPLFRMVLDDLTAVSDDALRRRAASTLARVTLGLLKHARDFGRFHREMARWTAILVEMLTGPGGRDAFASVLRYIYLVNDQVPPQKVAEQLGRLLGAGAKEAYVTYGEQLIQQGMERGREEGLGEGLRQGQVKLLRKQLEQRFGPLSELALKRLQTAGDEDLDRWAGRVLTAGTLDEVFEG
jgi:predicted transposase YdaD